MATATPNIMIKSIRGRIGNVVFYKRLGTQCARVHVIPRNPDTESQRAVRRAFADAVSSWQHLNADEKNEYIRKARYINMSGYNLYISDYLKRVINTFDPASPDELNTGEMSSTCNLELSTWNSIRFPSVSPSYMHASGTDIKVSGQNTGPEHRKLRPG